jgi:hypothetical protein
MIPNNTSVMHSEIVVAVFRENIEWIEKLSSVVDKISVYHKGGLNTSTNNNNNNNIISTNLSNVGREAHTFAYHILNNYENLSDYTIFLQGRPFDHMHYNSDTLIDALSNFQFKDVREPAFTSSELLHDWTGLSKKAYSRYFQGEAPEIYFSPGAQWIVPKKCILSKSKNLYQDIFNELSVDRYTNTDGVVNAWTMEGIWNYVFDENVIEKDEFF